MKIIKAYEKPDFTMIREMPRKNMKEYHSA
jgi:hypothetical protein